MIPKGCSRQASGEVPPSGIGRAPRIIPKEDPRQASGEVPPGVQRGVQQHSVVRVRVGVKGALQLLSKHHK